MIFQRDAAQAGNWHAMSAIQGMKHSTIIKWGLPALFLGLAACNNERPQATAQGQQLTTPETEQAEEAVKEYKTAKTPANAAQVREALAELDREIAELEALAAKREGEEEAEAQAKLRDLKRQRRDLESQFTQAKFNKLKENVQETLSDWGESIQETL